MIELNKIYNEDCRETMKRMPDNFVDCTITSPAYNLNLRISKGKYISRQVVKEMSSKYGDGSIFADNMPIEEYYQLHKGILTELLRVSKIVFYNIQIVTGSKRAFFRIIGDFYDCLKEVIVWDKRHAQPAMGSKVLNRQTELILVFEKDGAISRKFKKCNFLRGGLNDIWQIGRSKKVSKDHGAAFPEELVSKIITNFTDEDDIIYDCFMGTGTTAKVAKMHGRKYIGSEISKKYWELSESRIAKSEKKELDVTKWFEDSVINT